MFFLPFVFFLRVVCLVRDYCSRGVPRSKTHVQNQGQWQGTDEYLSLTGEVKRSMNLVKEWLTWTAEEHGAIEITPSVARGPTCIFHMSPSARTYMDPCPGMASHRKDYKNLPQILHVPRAKFHVILPQLSPTPALPTFLTRWWSVRGQRKQKHNNPLISSKFLNIVWAESSLENDGKSLSFCSLKKRGGWILNDRKRLKAGGHGKDVCVAWGGHVFFAFLGELLDVKDLDSGRSNMMMKKMEDNLRQIDTQGAIKHSTRQYVGTTGQY